MLSLAHSHSTRISSFDTLPANLPDARCYVLWNLEPRGKVPYMPTCSTRRASVSNPSTWGTLDDARGAVEDGKADGLGLVLTGDLVVFDLDHCIDPTTRQVSPDASSIVTQLPTYTECSPSGTGLHQLLFGTLPPGRRRRAGLEVYDRQRFITLTGAHLPDTPHEIVNQADTLQAIYPMLFPGRVRPVEKHTTNDRRRLLEADAELLARARRARNGARFSALWAGDTSLSRSASEADAALCRQLAFWTGRDPERIDTLFRQSGLMREKWDSRRGAETYGARTIAWAITMTPAIYRPVVNLIDQVEMEVPRT